MPRVQICLHTILATVLAITPVCGLSSPPKISPPTTVIPAELFGMHFHHLGGATPWPDAPIAEWRLWDAYVAWPNLQPARKRSRFETFDHYFAMGHRHPLRLLV